MVTKVEQFQSDQLVPGGNNKNTESERSMKKGKTEENMAGSLDEAVDIKVTL